MFGLADRGNKNKVLKLGVGNVLVLLVLGPVQTPIFSWAEPNTLN